MYTINKKDMQLIVNGASFLASGGGGGVASANAVIDNIISFSSEVTVAEASEVSADSQLLVICGVGAPDAPHLNFKNSPGDGLQGLQELTGKTYTHVLPIEVGAMNSMIPLLACAQLNIPFVDGDGAGRSVPEMSMCTYALKGFSPKETLVVSEEDTKYPVHPANAVDLEKQVRKIVSEKLQDAGTVATWSISGKQFQSRDAFVPGSLKLAHDIGKAMAGDQPLQGVESIVAKYYSDHRIIMRNAKVVAATNKVEDGFDVGTISVQDEHSGLQATLYFVNESLLALLSVDDVPLGFIMGPDMICSMGIDGSPMTNSEIYSEYAKGETVHISLMWVKAVEAIRTPLMFFRYWQLLNDKFGSTEMHGYRFIEEVIEQFE